MIKLELPVEEIEIEATTFIVDEMLEFGLDLRKHAASLSRMFVYAERMYRETMEEHLRRNDSDWQLRKNIPKREYDLSYGTKEFIDSTYPPWEDDYGRKRENPGVFAKSGGLPKGPLVAIYRVVDLWYKHYLKEKFVPRFGPDRKENPETYEWEKVPGTMVPRNPAAHLFLRVANELDNRYNAEYCRLVHNTERKTKYKTIPD